MLRHRERLGDVFSKLYSTFTYHPLLQSVKYVNFESIFYYCRVVCASLLFDVFVWRTIWLVSGKYTLSKGASVASVLLGVFNYYISFHRLTSIVASINLSRPTIHLATTLKRTISSTERTHPAAMSIVQPRHDPLLRSLPPAQRSVCKSPHL